MMVLRLAFLCSLAAAGCGGVDVEDIQRRQSSWREAEVRDYVFVSYRGCFCDLADRDGIRHEVRDGVVVSSVGVSTGLPFEEEAQTLDDVFDRAISSAREDPDEFSIAYDQEYGFIRRFHVDPDDGTEDDGFLLEVRCFSTDLEAGCPVTTLSEAECAEVGEAREVARPDPWQTCEYPGPIGRVSGTDRVCCED